jgi:hypothetical protein
MQDVFSVFVAVGKFCCDRPVEWRSIKGRNIREKDHTIIISSFVIYISVVFSYVDTMPFNEVAQCVML